MKILIIHDWEKLLATSGGPLIAKAHMIHVPQTRMPKFPVNVLNHSEELEEFLKTHEIQYESKDVEIAE